MGNSEDLLLPVFGLFSGLAILTVGLLKNARARAAAGFQRVPVGALKEKELQLFTGRAVSSEAVNSPVTQTPCAFYLETVEEFTGGRSSGWHVVEQKPYGGFYADDGTGRVLVLPGAACLELRKPETTGLTDGPPMGTYSRGVRRKEQFIAAGEEVTVIGTPVPLGTLLGALRGGLGLQLPPGLMNELLALEKEKGPVALLCVYGGGLRTVADSGYEAYLSNARASSSAYLQAGGLIAAAALGYILYILKGLLGSAPDVY